MGEYKKTADHNCVVQIGRLASDCRQNSVAGGREVVNFNLLATCGWGERAQTVSFACAWWGERSAVAKYLTKGREVVVFGRIEGIEHWEKNGKSGTQIKISVNDLKLGAPGKTERDGYEAARQLSGSAAQVADAFGGDLVDEEVPFQ